MPDPTPRSLERARELWKTLPGDCDDCEKEGPYCPYCEEEQRYVALAFDALEVEVRADQHVRTASACYAAPASYPIKTVEGYMEACLAVRDGEPAESVLRHHAAAPPAGPENFEVTTRVRAPLWRGELS